MIDFGDGSDPPQASLDGPSRAGPPTRAALERDAARIGAELSRLHGGTDPFAAAVRATRMPMIVTDPRRPDNPVVFANDSFVRLTGYTREEILGRNCRFLQGPETDPATVAKIRAAVEAAESIEIDVRNHRKDGAPFWNRLLLAPVRDAAGELAYFFASQVDVTLERERLANLEGANAALMAEVAGRARELEESEARLRFATEAGRLGVWELDLRTGEMAASAVCKENFGRDPAAPFGYADLRAAVHPGDAERVAAAVELTRRTGADYDIEYRVVRPDGAVAWVQIRARAVRGGDGAPARMAGISLDVTARKAAEDALRRLNEGLEEEVQRRTAELSRALGALRAEAAERAQAEEALRQSQKLEVVGQLTGGIAHDFNNMLQGVAGGLDLARKRIADGRPGEAGRYLEASRRAVDRAAGLTHRLLAFARKQTLAPRPVEVDALVRGMADLVRHTVGPAIAVEQRFSNGRWPVRCDANQLENALLNLAVNARDAMPGGGRLLIETAHEVLGAADAAGLDGAAPGDYVRITVADTGTGMSPQVLAHAFEPFFTTKPVGQGTGLGLSQVYGFVRQSGGTVRLESRAGEGTAVHLLLPRHAGEDDNHPGGPEPLSPPAAAPDGGKVEATVLLVEDEAGVRAQLTEALRDLGCRVLEAGDGDAGLDALEQASRGGGVDLLITDVGLPGGLNGRQLAEAARQRAPGLPVLLITGYAGPAMEGDGRLAPGVELLGKPFALEALTRRVASMLGFAAR